MSRKCSQIPDFESLSSELTGKPSCWKPKQMMKFLKYIKMEGLCDKFEDLEINGRIFLDLKSDSDILEDLCLTKKEEKLLLEYRNSLLEYEERLKTPKKNSREMEIMKKSLEEALNKKEVKIENPKFLLEEDKPKERIKNLKNTNKRASDFSENNSQKNKEGNLKKTKTEHYEKNDSDDEEEFQRKEEKSDLSRKEKNPKKQKISKVEENLDSRTKNKFNDKNKKEKNDKNKRSEVTDHDKKKPEKFKNSKVTSSDSDDDEVKPKHVKKPNKNDKNKNDEKSSSDSPQYPQNQKKDQKYVAPPEKGKSTSSFPLESENLPTVVVDRIVTKKKSSDEDKKDPTIPSKFKNKHISDSSEDDKNKITTIRKKDGLNENPEKTDPMYGQQGNSKNKDITIKKTEKQLKETTETTDRMYPKPKYPTPCIYNPQNIKNIFANFQTKYDGPTSGSEDERADKTEGTSLTNVCPKRELILEVHQTDKLNGEFELKKKFISLSNFSICRSKTDNNQNVLDLFDSKNSVSRDHAHVVLIRNRGFYLQSRSSVNHTLIWLKEKTRIILREGMEFVMSSTLFKVKTLKNDKITMEATLNYMKMESLNSEIKILEFTCIVGEKLNFGSSPIFEEEANRYIFEDDKTMKETQAVFYYDDVQDQVFLEPFRTGVKVFIKLGCKTEENPYYLIMKDNEISIGFFLLKVEKTFYSPAMVCKCCRNKFADCFFSSCLHCDICYECAKEKKKCPQSNCSSKEFQRLIDPYH